MTTIGCPLVSASGGWQRVHHWVALCAIALVAIAVASPPAAHAANARRQLEVQNHTAEPVRVFVAYHSITPGERWEWFNTDDTTSWLLQPGQRTLLVDRGFKINADLVRIRARAEKTGRQWNWGEVLIGVAGRGHSRVVGKTLFTIWAEEGLPLFSNRHTRSNLAVKNETAETLTVCVAYHTRDAEGAWGWQNTDCGVHWVIAPGKHSYLKHNGKRITANAVKVYALNDSSNRAWTDHRDEAIFIGDYEGTGGVEGSYTYAFTKANARRFDPLILRAVRLNPLTVSAGKSVEVVMEYTLDKFFSGKEPAIREEQRIERAGKVIGRFKNTVRRRPGTYRSKRTIRIPIIAEPGDYTVVGSVVMGRRVKSFLGVHVKPVTPEIAKQRGLKGTEGALVVDVKDGSPAREAGVRKNDVIVKFGDRTVKTPKAILRYTAEGSPGAKVALTVIRRGKERVIKVVLGKPPAGIPKQRVASKKVALRVTAP